MCTTLCLRCGHLSIEDSRGTLTVPPMELSLQLFLQLLTVGLCCNPRSPLDRLAANALKAAPLQALCVYRVCTVYVKRILKEFAYVYFA